MSTGSDEGHAGLSRRSFLSGVTASGVLVGAATVAGSTRASARSSSGRRGQETSRGGSAATRAEEAFDRRYDAMSAYLRAGPARSPKANGDEERYPDLRASFTKTLPQNDLGEVEPAAFTALRDALAAGSFDRVERVPLAPEAERGLVSPLAAHAFEMIGPDAWAPRMRPAPGFASEEAAAEMVEVYWQAITRDVPFRDYGSHPDVLAASEDLASRPHRVGTASEITPQTVFRGETPRQWVGPYVSQLLWLPARWGVVDLDQRFSLPTPGQDFAVDHSEWIALQRGVSPSARTGLDPTPRHIASARDLAEYVHGDVTYQAYLTAALAMLAMGEGAVDPGNPYLGSVNQNAFVTFGVAEIADLVAKAANAALKAAWYEKWLVHRRLRPEAFAGRAAFQASGARDYDIAASLFESEAAARLQRANGGLFLPLAFPEGSPVHPSYPAGHAAIAGACATVLKALFDEDFVVPEPVEASADGLSLDAWRGEALTLGGEIDKLASNISLGRDAAGVHYRSDGIDGMALGEEVALGLLGDYARTRAERFAGFTLTRFDGTTVLVGGDGTTSRPRPRGSRKRDGFGRESA